MDMLTFPFIEDAVQAVSANDINIDIFINTLNHIYNLLLLWFWWDIMKYTVKIVTIAFNRLNKFKR